MQKTKARQRVRIGKRAYTRTVSAIWWRSDGLAETPHGLVTVNGRSHIVKLVADEWIEAGQKEVKQ